MSLRCMVVTLKAVMEEDDARDKVDNGAKRRLIKDRDCANEQNVDGKPPIYHLLLSPSRKCSYYRRISSYILTMLMDRTYDIPNSVEHFRDMIADWEVERTYISHGNKHEHEQEKPGEAMGNEDITK